MKWYDHNKRDLPWRDSKLFYPVYLSEVMLQQTQVKTVIPFYKKWLIRFPSIESVAISNIDELLKLWEGLGYYSRCKNMYKTSQLVNSSLPSLVSRTSIEYSSM